MMRFFFAVLFSIGVSNWASADPQHANSPLVPSLYESSFLTSEMTSILVHHRRTDDNTNLFGTRTGLFSSNLLINNHRKLISKLTVPTLSSFLHGGLRSMLVSTAFFSYGSYLLGDTNLQTANRNMIAATTGSAMGFLSGVTAISFVTTFGTASTGTAISTLYGAAATKATLAWFGGGALTAGGGGTAVGATVLTGGVALVTMAVGGGVMYLFHLDDEHTERERVQHLLDSIHNDLNLQVTRHKRNWPQP